MGSSDYKSIALVAATSLALFAMGRSAPAATDFGPNVFTFDAATPTAAIQDRLNLIFAGQHRNEFGTNRYCLLFRPGHYTNLDVNLGYYTEVCGLGQMPGDVVIVGDVHSEGRLRNHNATVNFWRSCGNITIVPTNNGTMTWAVSQGTALRRVHVAGRLNLANTGQGAYSSGGFMADSQVDSVVNSLSQQQWLSRNDALGAWTGGVWNMMFVGVVPPPVATWPAPPHTVIPRTPLIRERPYLCLDNSGDFVVQVPGLQTNAAGTTWSHGPAPVTTLPIGRFHVAQPGRDSSASINAALSSGLNLILTPGVYHLPDSIRVTRPDTVVLGLGYPTLVPTGGFPAMIVSDVDGVKVAGIIFDAGNVKSRCLLEVGPGMTSRDHAADPICLYDLCARVGGATIGTAGTCVVINAHNVVGDNFWLWRADHGAGANWTQNASDGGLVVNGDDVTIYGLFVEHFEQYQTLWNGNRGRVYFYQSELPYDAPSQKDWSHDGVNGYASYKVADTVASHQAYGLGIYGVFTRTSTSCFNAIETPTNSPQVNLQNMTTVCIIAQRGTSSQITHIVNGNGKTVGPGRSTATLASSASDSSVPVRMGLLRPED